MKKTKLPDLRHDDFHPKLCSFFGIPTDSVKGFNLAQIASVNMTFFDKNGTQYTLDIKK